LDEPCTDERTVLDDSAGIRMHFCQIGWMNGIMDLNSVLAVLAIAPVVLDTLGLFVSLGGWLETGRSLTRMRPLHHKAGG
jgi:hypothetical protein